MSDKVFLAHSHKDEHIAAEIRAMLRAYRIDCCMASIDVEAGADWMQRLRDEIGSSGRLLVLVTPRSINSPWVIHETGAAYQAGIEIIPLLMFVEALDLPEFWRHRQTVPIEEHRQLEDFVSKLALSSKLNAPRVISMSILTEKIRAAADKMRGHEYFPKFFVGSGRRGSVCAAVFASDANNARFKAVDCEKQGSGHTRSVRLDARALADPNIQNENVLVVEWARDSGRTFSEITKVLKGQNPAGIKSYAMVWTGQTESPDYYGFMSHYVPLGPWALYDRKPR